MSIVTRTTADSATFREIREGRKTTFEFDVPPETAITNGDAIYVREMEQCRSCDSATKKHVYGAKLCAICNGSGFVGGEEMYLEITSGRDTLEGSVRHVIVEVRVMTVADMTAAGILVRPIVYTPTAIPIHKEILRSCRARLKGSVELHKLLLRIVEASQWFEAMPLPDDCWEVEMKAENAKQLQDWVVELRGGGELVGTSTRTEVKDPAAVMAIAMSLRKSLEAYSLPENVTMSDLFQGIDNLFRACMHVATVFEVWACDHVFFDEVVDVWPYLLEDKFGDAFLQPYRLGREEFNTLPTDLTSFIPADCLNMAMKLGLPLLYSDEARMPLLAEILNPVPRSIYKYWRIQTVRHRSENEEAGWEPLVYGDNPHDPDWDYPELGFYGVFEDGTLEHLSDHPTYAAAVERAKRLAPTADFPEQPIIHPPGWGAPPEA